MADVAAQRSRPKGDMQMSVLQKRYKIDDGKSKYIEQSTLLEPSNVVTHKQDEEEMKEVSVSLAELKKKHDIVKKRVLEKERDLEIMKKEIQQLELQEGNAESVVYENTTRKDQIENAVKVTKKKTNEELMNARIRGHMMQRIKKDLIAMEIKKKNMETSLRNKNTMYEEQKDKYRKTKEQRLQSKNIFDNLIKNLFDDRNEKKKRIEMLGKSITNKQNNVKRRADRIRRQNELAEAAANENKDADEKQMRKEFMFNKLWNAFIRKKMVCTPFAYFLVYNCCCDKCLLNYRRKKCNNLLILMKHSKLLRLRLVSLTFKS
jgi:chromosome segregation ATPase